jgi:hypothetical protein
MYRDFTDIMRQHCIDTQPQGFKPATSQISPCIHNPRAAFDGMRTTIAKRRRIDNFRRTLPNVSQTALAAIIREVREGNLPDGTVTRRTLHEAQIEILERRTEYGTLGTRLQLHGVDGGVVHTVVINLLSFLQHAFDTCHPFRRFLTQRHAAHPSSPNAPWRLVLYGDEYNPGLELVARHARKQWMTYATFLEFGAVALEREAMWVSLSAFLTSEADKLDSGYSQLMGHIVQNIFKGSTDPRRAGLVLHHGDEIVELYFDLAGFLMDGLANKILFGTKGDNGTRLCTRCINFYAAASAVVADGSDGIVGASQDFRALVPATDESVYESVRKLAAKKATETNDNFQVWSQAIGFNHLEHGMLNQAGCRDVVLPVTHSLVEPAHTFCIGGVINTVWYLYFTELNRAGVQVFPLWRAFLNEWHWPGGVGAAQIREIFSVGRVRRWREAGTLKCQANELIMLIPLLGFYVASFGLHAGGACLAEATTVMALIDLYEAATLRRSGDCSAGDVLRRVHKFLDWCVHSNWEEFMHPKFHWLLHCSELVLSALVCEAKHRVPKRYARETCNLVGFDRGVLANVTGQHLWQLADEDSMNFGPRLLNPRPASPNLVALLNREFGPGVCQMSSRAALATRGTCQRSDVVLVHSTETGEPMEAGEVWAICSFEDVPMCVISRWGKHVSACRQSGSARWRKVDQPEFYPLDSVLCSTIWREYPCNVICALVPIQYRDSL